MSLSNGMEWNVKWDFSYSLRISVKGSKSEMINDICLHILKRNIIMYSKDLLRGSKMLQQSSTSIVFMGED